jgi:hypothetical protein
MLGLEVQPVIVADRSDRRFMRLMSQPQELMQAAASFNLLRASDLIGRYGGEEFMLILTETNVEDGAALAEKLRTLVERERFDVPGNQQLSVTISIGIVGGIGQQLRTETLVRDADAAMYSAKSLGRNQTYILAEPDDEARVPGADLERRARARRRDRATGTRRGGRLPDLRHRATAGAPRSTVGDDCHDRRRDGQLPAASQPGDRTHSRGGAAP